MVTARWPEPSGSATQTFASFVNTMLSAEAAGAAASARRAESPRRRAIVNMAAT